MFPSCTAGPVARLGGVDYGVRFMVRPVWMRLIGCGAGPWRPLQARLAPDISAGRVALDRLPDGARVTLADPDLFASGGTALGNSGQVVLTGVIQGLVDPSLLRIAVTGSAAMQGDGQGAQTQAVTQYFDEYGLGQALQSSAPATPLREGRRLPSG